MTYWGAWFKLKINGYYWITGLAQDPETMNWNCTALKVSSTVWWAVQVDPSGNVTGHPV
jgi:hypothetical protein